MHPIETNNERSSLSKKTLLLGACILATLLLMFFGVFYTNSEAVTAYINGYKTNGMVKNIFLTNYSSNYLTREVTPISSAEKTISSKSIDLGVTTNSTVLSCPKTPLGLVGRMKYDNAWDINPPNSDGIYKNNLRLEAGGRYTPPDCRAQYKVAIIIPLRGRETQLRTLLNHMHPIWQRQQLDYTVYTIWQSGENLFNRAKLINIGFSEASKERKYDCYVFHDVDLLLMDDRCLYWCPEEDNPRSISVYIDKFKFRPISYASVCAPEVFKKKGERIHLFGGVSMLTPKQLNDINGCSNAYWGWGGEDDDLYIRLWSKGYKIQSESYNKSCVFHMIKHTREKSNASHLGRFSLINKSLLRMGEDGLNSLKYGVLSIKREPLYTNITVDIGAPSKVLQQFMSQNISNLWSEKCNRTIPYILED
uniref:beta-1,4-galactosyltransferase 2-like n=1 Tax=Styela clava TaxID=7725 RepID=UPI0019397168|nr:beta-1,4-galactosyltransferase 2-like [Styela clava]